MQTNLHQALRELQSGKWHPVYVVLGEESFQANEVLDALKGLLLKDRTARDFNFEAWDGEQLDGQRFIESLNTLPGLFQEEGSTRLVVLSRLEKVPSSVLENLEAYLKSHSPDTCLFLMGAKADKRKSWYKAADALGAVLEVQEPYDRDWPKWQGYFEKKLKKTLSPDAWRLFVESSGRSLSVLWADLRKAATYVGENPEITLEDARTLLVTSAGGTVFDFVDDVMCRRSLAALRRFHDLLRSGENEVKLLSLIVRQFRLVEGYLRLSQQGEDPKGFAPKLGVHPYFLTQLQKQSSRHTLDTLKKDIARLAETDFRLKTGEGTLFESFLAPYMAG